MAFKTRLDVIRKIDWEGGLDEALRYGIKADDMPDAELHEAWRALELAFIPFQQAEDRVADLLNEEE